MARNLKIILAYDGQDFAGWQVQPGLATIQGTLLSAIEHLTGEKALPQGSGRTDAGVHALAQVATVTIESPIPSDNLRKALNDVLPKTIRILSIEDVPHEFHARKAARAKTYRYRIYRDEICPPFLARYVYHHPYPLNEEHMAQAAALVVGTHDFTSFAAVDPERRDAPAMTNDSQSHLEKAEPANIRTIFSSQWSRQGPELVYEVRGSGFLHHMVRNLVGTFLMVGKRGPGTVDIQKILAARDRSAASATAPADGLFLVSVEY
jgi:tRNA pseudouridine38-40 synthase